MGIKSEAARLQRGEITFSEFYRNTKKDWDRAAGAIFKRWELPLAVEKEDVVQEMLLAMFKHMPRHDPTRASFGEFAFYRARTGSMRWLHKQRGALRQMGSSPSRVERTEATLRRRRDETGEEVAKMLDVVVEAPHDAIEAADTIRHVAGQLDNEQLFLFLAFFDAQGDVEVASEMVYEDKKYRLAAQLGSPREAVKRINRAVEIAADIARAIARAA